MIKKSFLILLFFAFYACSTSMSNLQVETDYDPMADFSKFKTYAFMPGTGVHSTNKKVNNDFVNSRIQKAIDQEMRSKGFIKTSYPEGNPDVWVAFTAILDRKSKSKVRQYTGDIRDWGAPGIDYYVSTSYYDEGSLLFDLVNPKTSKPVYKAIAKAELKMDVSWQEKEKRIDLGVKKCLKDYPPPK